MISIIKIINRLTAEIIQALRGDDRHDSITKHLVTSSSGSFLINISNQILLFITSIILARLMGASDYGVYIYALTWILVLNIPAGLGLPRMLIRNIAAYHSQSMWSLIAGQLRWAILIVIIPILLIISLTLIATLFIESSDTNNSLNALRLAIILLPIITYISINQSITQGFHRVVLGQMSDSLIQPISLIILLVIAYTFINQNIDSLTAIRIHIIAALISLAISIYISFKVTPRKVRNATPTYQSGVWFRSALALMFMGFLNIINSRADILMLGAIAGSEQVGIYNIANRGSEIVTFMLLPVHTSLGPTISKLYTSNDYERLQRIIKKSTIILTLLSAPIAIVLIAFGHWFLLIFGESFTQGQLALTILSAGKLINVLIGPVALLLIMTHHERHATIGLGVAALLNIILNSLLIPIWGLEGAAVASACSMIVWSMLLSIFVYNKIGVQSGLLNFNIRK